MGCSQAVDHGLPQRRRALAAAGEALVDLGAVRAGLEGQALDELDLLVGVARAAVDRHHAGQAERLDDAEVAAQVGGALLDRLQASRGPTRGSSSRPPWCLSARTVATSTTALGRMPPLRQTMSKNFSMPMSEPKPDSVTT